MPSTPDDKLISATIESVSALIVSRAAAERHLTLEQATERFLQSQTYFLLADKNTGYYWDSIPELMRMFTAELESSPESQHESRGQSSKEKKA
jgi:hypothetical protein